MLLSTQTGSAVGKLGFENGIKCLHDAGYDCLDLSLFEMINANSVYDLDNWKDTVNERRRFADANGIVFDQSHAPFSFNWANEELKKNFADPMVLRSLEISAMMGVKNIVVHPLHWFPFKGHEDEARKLNIEYYKSFIPYCKEFNIRVCVENMWQKEVKRKCISDDVCSRAAEFASYIDEIDSEWIVACLDVGHCSLIGEEAQDAIRVLGHDRLHALHVHDNDYQGDRHTLPGQGMMDWNAIMAALKDIDYDGVFTYEADGFLRYIEPDFLPNACRYMVETGRYLINKMNK